MRKVKEFFIKNKKNIFLVLVFLIILSITNNITFARINSNSSEFKADGFMGNVIDGVTQAISWFINNTIGLVTDIAAGTISRLISGLLTAIAGIGFVLLYTIWTMLGGSLLSLPFPDRIIFNKMSFFDPNFINPTPQSELYGVVSDMNFMNVIQKAVSGIYFTFFIVAGLLMVIAAMVIGIKLALSSIAVEKAQYKEVLNRWIVGIVLLFTLHFIILGIFTINESVCEIASKIADNCVFQFDIHEMNPVTKVAGGIKAFFKGIWDAVTTGEFSWDPAIRIPFEGYSGIIMYLVFMVVANGDIISSIALMALVGQTFNLIFRYLKRFIFIIGLAMIAPLVLAVDVIKRAI